MTAPGMNPDERDRLARLEARFDSMEGWVQSMDGKLDKLLTAASMGQGAWKFMLWVGGILAGLAAASAWVWDHLPKGWH
jgi:hypothetical protein